MDQIDQAKPVKITLLEMNISEREALAHQDGQKVKDLELYILKMQGKSIRMRRGDT